MATSTFSVLVNSPHPDRTAGELRAQGIEVRKPAEGAEEINESDWVFGPEILAVVESEDADSARERIEAIVGPHCEVFPAQPYGGGG
jgi:hypothetical protein